MKMIKFSEWLEANAKLGDVTDHPLYGQPQQSSTPSMAIPLDKNPKGNSLIDPESGQDYSGPNPYYDNNTGAVIDEKKARAWESKKRQVQQINSQIVNTNQQRATLIKSAEKEVSSLIDNSVDGLIKHGIRNPMEHQGFKARMQEIMQKYGLTPQETNQIWRNMKSKLLYITSSIDNPERRQSHLANAQKQFEKKIGVRPLNQ